MFHFHISLSLAGSVSYPSASSMEALAADSTTRGGANHRAAHDRPPVVQPQLSTGPSYAIVLMAWPPVGYQLPMPSWGLLKGSTPTLAYLQESVSSDAPLTAGGILNQLSTCTIRPCTQAANEQAGIDQLADE